MHRLKVIYKSTQGKALSYVLVSDLYDVANEQVAIVTDRPMPMMAAVKKQWLYIIRRKYVERARTLSQTRIKEINDHLKRMHGTQFSAKPPTDGLEAGVTFATADDFVQIAPTCRVMFVTYSFPKIKLHMMTSWMPKDGVVIIYG